MNNDSAVLTTGEVAKICNVAPRTVSKWFDTGALKGYRIPGSKDRRIPLKELVRFMKAHGIPTDGLETGATRVLIADDDREVCDVLCKVLREQTGYVIHSAAHPFQAGLICEKVKPHVLVLDLHLGESDARSILNMVRETEGLQFTKVIAMSGKLTDGQIAGVRAAGFAGFLKKPFQVRSVVEAIEQATNIAA